MTVSSRRIWQLDEVRALLVFGVVAFHVVRLYDPFDFYVKSRHEADVAGILVVFVGLWGIPLFFALAGHAVHGSLRTRSGAAFLRDRALRLGVPFVVGVALLVPPQVYAMHRGDGRALGITQTIVEFFDVHWTWRLPLPIDGPSFEPAHLWFLAYLLCFSVLLLPVFAAIERPLPARWLATRARRGAGTGVLLALVIAVATIEGLLGGEDAGGWNRWTYPLFLTCGYIAAAHPDLLSKAERRRRALALGGCGAFMLLAATGAVLYDRLGEAINDSLVPAAVAWRALKTVACVLLVASICGLLSARIRANRGLLVRDLASTDWRARAVARAIRLALPAYLVHQTVIVLVAFAICPAGLPAQVELPTILVASLTLTIVVSELVCRTTILRPITGVTHRDGPWHERPRARSVPPAPRFVCCRRHPR